jgi:hypothetical protein
MNTDKLTYRQLQTALKRYRKHGHPVPPLNSKREVLEASYLQCRAKVSSVVRMMMAA